MEGGRGGVKMIYSFVSDSSTNNKLKGKKKTRIEEKRMRGKTSVGHAAPQAEGDVQFVHVL